jgi:signal transduction histidine kinase
LTIARNLIAAHGGTIAARARAEGGTSVEFKLPRLATSD